MSFAEGKRTSTIRYALREGERVDEGVTSCDFEYEEGVDRNLFTFLVGKNVALLVY